MRNAVMAPSEPERAKNRSKQRISPQVKKSSATIIRCRGSRSASTPPRGERRTVGTMARARMLPNTAAEPVRESTCRDREKRRMALPNREMIWPMTIRVKSRRKGEAGFIKTLLLLNTDGRYVL